MGRVGDVARSSYAAWCERHGKTAEESNILPFYGARTCDGPLAALSNFYTGVSVLGFPSGEHFLHFMKAMLFGDREIAAQIAQAKTPFEAKRLGRRVRGFDEEQWERASLRYQVAACKAKLRKIPSLVDHLEGKYVVEASPRDCVWGVGVGIAKAKDPKNWRGRNRLGIAWVVALGAI